MNMLWRRIAGVVVLAISVMVGIAVVPPYVRNAQFQRYLDSAVARPQAPEMVQAAVMSKAGEMGLPVRTGDVRVVRAGNGVVVDIVYVVRVDFPLYTVDLHFHPSASTE